MSGESFKSESWGAGGATGKLEGSLASRERAGRVYTKGWQSMARGLNLAHQLFL